MRYLLPIDISLAFCPNSLFPQGLRRWSCAYRDGQRTLQYRRRSRSRAYRVAGGVKTCERAFVIGVHPGIVQGSNAWSWLAAQNLGYRKQQS